MSVCLVLSPFASGNVQGLTLTVRDNTKDHKIDYVVTAVTAVLPDQANRLVPQDKLNQPTVHSGVVSRGRVRSCGCGCSFGCGCSGDCGS